MALKRLFEAEQQPTCQQVLHQAMIAEPTLMQGVTPRKVAAVLAEGRRLQRENARGKGLPAGQSRAAPARSGGIRRPAWLRGSVRIGHRTRDRRQYAGTTVMRGLTPENISPAYPVAMCPTCPMYPRRLYSSVCRGHVLQCAARTLREMYPQEPAARARCWLPRVHRGLPVCTLRFSLFLQGRGYVGHIGYIDLGYTGEKKLDLFRVGRRRDWPNGGGGPVRETRRRLLSLALSICFTLLYQNTCVGAKHDVAEGGFRSRQPAAGFCVVAFRPIRSRKGGGARDSSDIEDHRTDCQPYGHPCRRGWSAVHRLHLERTAASSRRGRLTWRRP